MLPCPSLWVLHTLSGKTSYHQASPSSNMWVKWIALEFDRHLGSSAAQMPVKFQNDMIMLTPNLMALKFMKFGSKRVLLLNEERPWTTWIYHDQDQTNRSILQLTLVYVQYETNLTFRLSRDLYLWKWHCPGPGWGCKNLNSEIPYHMAFSVVLIPCVFREDKYAIWA